MTADLAEKVREALRLVLDPELGENVVDLGLVYDVVVDKDGTVCVTMTTTTPGCPATAFLVEGVRNCVLAVPGVAGGQVDLTYDPPWTPDRMSEKAKAGLTSARDEV